MRLFATLTGLILGTALLAPAAHAADIKVLTAGAFKPVLLSQVAGFEHPAAPAGRQKPGIVPPVSILAEDSGTSPGGEKGARDISGTISISVRADGGLPVVAVYSARP